MLEVQVLYKLCLVYYIPFLLLQEASHRNSFLQPGGLEVTVRPHPPAQPGPDSLLTPHKKQLFEILFATFIMIVCVEEVSHKIIIVVMCNSG